MFSFKFILNNEIRRFSCDAKEDLALEGLRSKISEVFPSLGQQSFDLLYTDDEDDLVSISSDLELREALRIMEAMYVETYKFIIRDGSELYSPPFSKRQLNPAQIQRLKEKREAQKSGKPGQKASDPEEKAKKMVGSWRRHEKVESDPSIPKPSLRFMRHVSFPDGTTVEPNVELKKTWRVRNDGDQPWPKGVVLVPTGGDMMCPADSIFPVRTLDNGKGMDLTVNITSPANPGRYTAYFRMQTETGQKFGQRLWIDLLVSTDSSDADASNDEAFKGLSEDVEPVLVQGPQIFADKSFKQELKAAKVERQAKKKEMNQLKRLEKQNQQAVKKAEKQEKKAVKFVDIEEKKATKAEGVPEHVPSIAPAIPELPKCALRFVRHGTFPDGTVVQPNTVIKKKWRVRNDGEVAWPAGTVLAPVDGDRLCPPNNTFPTALLTPGEAKGVLAMLKAPSAPGRYVSYFRMQNADGQKFGQRLSVEVVVASVGEESGGETTDPEWQVVVEGKGALDGDAAVDIEA